MLLFGKNISFCKLFFNHDLEASKLDFSVLKHKPTDFQDETDMLLESRRASIEAKRQQAIQFLGDKWILHPNHKPMKREPKMVLQ